MARRGDMVVTAELSQTIRADTWNGVRVRIVSPSAGPVDANWFGFAEHRLFNEGNRAPSARDGGAELTAYNAEFMLTYDGIDADRLRDAVAAYTSAFVPAPAPEFTVAAKLGALHATARQLDHLGSINPQHLAGRAFAHAEVLREVVGEIHLGLLPLAGEWRGADSSAVELSDGLAALGTVRTALTELACGAEEAGHTGQAQLFREHARSLDAIDAEISADLAADRAAAPPPSRKTSRAGAARTANAAVAMSAPATGSVAQAAPRQHARPSR
ncbi:hypothetical protein [Kitasatospora sp. A2-31]|uniref:hypothetical protein n=1 Tax=Kitasatospora sp. A2-31 TaxID=2916414 RepID=UPI001EEB3149|nr:hypothetical protein [Kitasatospora sp. A2-31]MCG6497080.1 hypothetical protein [Kitasatospora sp. A2-31]